MPRSAVQRRGEQPGDPLVVDRARFARPQLVVQSRDALLDEAPAPLPEGRVGHAEPLGHSAVGDIIGTYQDQAGALHQPSRQRDRASDVSCIRWSSLKLSSAFGRPIAIGVSPPPKAPLRLLPHLSRHSTGQHASSPSDHQWEFPGYGVPGERSIELAGPARRPFARRMVPREPIESVALRSGRSSPGS
jgi:hypothetical protein